MSTSPLRPGTPVRTLPSVLRQALSERDAIRLDLAQVVDVPDSAHITVTFDEGATQITVPKLDSYGNAGAGDVAYILSGGYWSLALGTVK